MSTLHHGNFRLASQSLKAAKSRSFLTMLGVIIGVTAVICVVCIGEGVKQQIADKVNQFGKDLITIRPGSADQSPLKSGSAILGGGLPMATSSLLTEKDLKTVKSTPGVGLAVPLSTIPGSLRGDYKVNAPYIIATGSALPEAINQKIAYGSFFSDDESINGIILGQKLAEKLFNERVPLGRTIVYHGQNFIVEGIFDLFDVTPFSLSADFNDAAFVSYQKAKSMTTETLGIYQILSKPTNPNLTEAVAGRIRSNLNKSHGGSGDTAVLTEANSMTSSNQVIHLITLSTVGVALIALVVGGIGIMDVMLVSVTERMHEIGVRKALGATNQQILRQFMTESLVISLVGAVIGSLLALMAVGAMRLFTSLQPVLVWQAFVLAIVIAVIIGVVFGTAPALKAARKDPIEALRHV